MWKSIIKNLGATNGTPWSVNNVKSSRTDTINGTVIGDEIDDDTGVGHTYQVDSTSIQSARFDPSDSSLNIVYRGGDKEYKYAANENDAKAFLQSPSKGRFINWWNVTDSHRYPGY